jgi:hypothetical protein
LERLDLWKWDVIYIYRSEIARIETQVAGWRERDSVQVDIKS